MTEISRRRSRKTKKKTQPLSLRFVRSKYTCVVSNTNAASILSFLFILFLCSLPSHHLLSSPSLLSSTSTSGLVFINAFSLNNNNYYHHNFIYSNNSNKKKNRNENTSYRYFYNNEPTISSTTTSTTTTRLDAVQKSQTAIYDGAEYVSILGYLMTEPNPRIGFVEDSLHDGDNQNQNEDGGGGAGGGIFVNTINTSMKESGYVTFVTGSLPSSTSSSTSSSSEKIIAVQAPITKMDNQNENKNKAEASDDSGDSGDSGDNGEITVLDEAKNVYVYTDSIAVIPKGISPNDAISTASAALCGVHCGMPMPVAVGVDDSSSTNQGKTVVLGGGDYACFTARALSDGFGVDVNLVTTRPMSLKDTPLNPLRGSKVNAMSPTIVKETSSSTTATTNTNLDDDDDDEDDDDIEVGFSEALGQFDTCIDTLGDEAKMSKVRTIQDGIDRVCGNVGVAAKLAQENQCKRYISTLTKSQQFVLKEGILFARDPVLDYQKRVEKDKDLIAMAASPSLSSSDSGSGSGSGSGSDSNYQILPPPRNYGKTLETLFNKRIIYPTDRNENGSHANKKVFVRGCSFPDYAEVEIWPQDSTDGAAVRFGFPGIRELTLEARMDTMMGAFDKGRGPANGRSGGGAGGGASTSTNTSTNTSPGDEAGALEGNNAKKKKKQQNPFVVEIESLSDITDEIRNTKKDAVLFVSAPYCRLCRAIGPLFNRMARISKEELNSDLQFAKAVTGSGKAMKQLTFTLQIDSVPTFVLFRGGERYGEPFGVTKLPSVKLNRAIECLKAGKEWDPEIMDIDEGGSKMRTKI